jgi:hypothetical protein
LPLSRPASWSGLIDLRFHRRDFRLLDGVGSSGSGRRRETKFNRRIPMKYLLIIVAALALVGTANATSRSADCCGGNGCCLIKLPCCAK